MPVRYLGLLALTLTQAAPSDRTVRGEVRTADGAGVVGADVWVFGTRAPTDSTIAATTDGAGGFKFTLPVSETSALVVRRRGFQDVRVPLPFDPGGSAKKPVTVAPVTLAPLGGPLATVVVPDTGRFSGSSSAFYRHVASRRGDYVTRADIARQAPTRTSNLMRTMRGVNLVSSGGGAYVQLRGRRCYAAVWLDGTALGARAFDVDAISPASLIGVEVYSTPGDLPPDYQTYDAMNCGAVGFWTLRGENGAENVLEPASVREPATVRVSSEVQEPAQLAPGATFAPSYPSAARVAGLAGDVLVELVVDTAGVVEPASVGVVATSSAEFVDATLRAAQRLRFTPARAAGHPVRQLVHLVAQFRPGPKPKK